MNKNSKEKFKVFLEVAHELNINFNVAPLLFGSLGLSLLIKEDIKVNDIDVLLSSEFLGIRWIELIAMMKKMGFELINEKEHAFQHVSFEVAFGDVGDLKDLIAVNPDDLSVIERNGVKYKVLTLEQYLDCYTKMLRDEYRQEKRGNADKVKIELIKNNLSL